MRRSTRRVLWERAGQQPDKPNDDCDDAGQGDAHDPAMVETVDDVFGDTPSDPIMDAYDLPDDRLCSVDTPMSADHIPAGLCPRSAVLVERDDVCERTHVQVFLPSDARAKLRAGGSDGGATHLLSSASDDKGQARRWHALATDAMRGWRSRLFANAGMVAQIGELRAQAPNFDRLLDIVVQSLRASIAANAAVRLPPLLLLGPPGVAKSFIAARLARTIGTSCVSISMPTATNGNPFGGLAATWKTPVVGIVADALTTGTTASPLIMIDEIDKPFRIGAFDQPLDPLHTLLETETARAFKDEFLEIAFDASHVFWIATANDTASIPPAVLDRFVVLDIAAPELSQMRVMIKAIVGGATGRYPGWFEDALADEVIACLSALHPRRLRQVSELACTNAVASGRHGLALADVEAAMRLLSTGRTNTRIGFFA
jgi:ATP-dependent Lon protease